MGSKRREGMHKRIWIKDKGLRMESINIERVGNILIMLSKSVLEYADSVWTSVRTEAEADADAMLKLLSRSIHFSLFASPFACEELMCQSQQWPDTRPDWAQTQISIQDQPHSPQPTVHSPQPTVQLVIVKPFVS